MTEVDRVREARVQEAARKTAELYGKRDDYEDALTALLGAKVVVLADDAAARVREAQERAWQEGYDEATYDQTGRTRTAASNDDNPYADPPCPTDAADTQPEKETP